MEDIDSFLHGLNHPIPNIATPNNEQIQAAVKYSRNSATGPDGILGALYRAVPELSVTVFWPCVDSFTDASMAPPPPAHMAAELALPPKVIPEACDGLEYEVVQTDKTRPISVHNFSVRICAAAFREGTNTNVDSVCSSEQEGFRESTMGNIMDVDSSLHFYYRHKIRGGAFLANISRAFPTISHNYIRRSLERNGAPDWYLVMFSRMYTGMHHFLVSEGDEDGEPGS